MSIERGENLYQVGYSLKWMFWGEVRYHLSYVDDSCVSTAAPGGSTKLYYDTVSPLFRTKGELRRWVFAYRLKLKGRFPRERIR